MANACQRQDCEFFSMFTFTCDYTLMNSRKRPCPIDGCTEYRQRTERRPWMKYWFAGTRQEGGEEMLSDVPERAAENEARSVVAACGHEVYDGEYIYIWLDGEAVCPDCFEDRFADLSTERKANLCGCEASPVRFEQGRGGHAEKEI